MSYQKRYEDLLYSFRSLQQRNKDLQKDIDKINDRLDDQNARVRELEPLEQASKDRYDAFVTSGSGDPCFSAGMAGRCGPECEVYGSKPECDEWISVEHMMPGMQIDPKEDWDCRSIKIRFNDGHETISDVGTIHADKGRQITHWMPLPTPPERSRDERA